MNFENLEGLYQEAKAKAGLFEAAEIQEAAIAGVAYEPSGRLKITIIKAGFNKSKARFYPAEVLKRDHKIFENAKMFINHQHSVEEKLRPEGDLRDWVANITKVWVEGDGTIKAEAAVHDPTFRAKLAELKKQGLLNEMGISIRAAGTATKKEVQGTKTDYIEGLTKARSVDFVTFPGAGGRVDMMESDEVEEAYKLLGLNKDESSLAAKLEMGALNNDQKRLLEAAQLLGLSDEGCRKFVEDFSG